jgi:hypothetical protein
MLRAELLKTIGVAVLVLAVLLENWLHRWEELKPHQQLAIAIATIATLVAIFCFLGAGRLLRERI